MKLHRILFTSLLLAAMSASTSGATVDTSSFTNDKTVAKSEISAIKAPLPASLFLMAPVVAGFLAFGKHQ